MTLDPPDDQPPRYAHSLPDAPRSRWETMPEHSGAVAGRAAGFAARFGAEQAGRAAGILHDIGKVSAAFQARIGGGEGSDARVDHSTAGAVEAERLYRIYVTEGAILNDAHREAYVALRPGDDKARTDKKLNPKGDAEAQSIRRWMCDNFFDIRTFGAVLSTGVNAGQVRGPVQITFGRSVEPVLPLEISITRMAATNEKEKAQRAEGGDDERTDNRTMGRKHIIPYGLYRAHGFVSAPLASHSVKGTGFTEADLALLWKALSDMFEHDRSAARGEMATRALVVFEHEGKLGNAHAETLFDTVKVWRKKPGEGEGDLHAIGSAAIDNWPAARSFDDYAITVGEGEVPAGVTVRRIV